MTSTTTLNETILNPVTGSEFVRIATSGANWKNTISGIFNSSLNSALGITTFNVATAAPVLIAQDSGSLGYNVLSFNNNNVIPSGTSSTSISIVAGGPSDNNMYFIIPGVGTASGYHFTQANNSTARIEIHPGGSGGNQYISFDATTGGGGSSTGLLLIPNASGDNWYIGGAGPGSTTGVQNMGMGHAALQAAGGGSFNIGIGVGALLQAPSPGNSVAIGTSALANLTGSGVLGNTAVGDGAIGGSTVGFENTGIGHRAGYNISTGGQYNVCIGGWIGPGTAITGGTITSASQCIVIGSGADVSSASTNGQMSIGNFIYGTGLTSFGSTISTGWIGIGVKAAYGAEFLGVAGGVAIAGDPGAGVAATNIFTNSNSTTISTGTGTVKMSSANNANNTGWLKCYIGTQVAWIPCWTTNAP